MKSYTITQWQMEDLCAAIYEGDLTDCDRLIRMIRGQEVSESIAAMLATEIKSRAEENPC